MSWLRFGVVIALIFAGYWISTLPEHYRVQGDARTEAAWKKKLDAAVLAEELRVNALYAKKELENEKRFNALQNDHRAEVAIVQSKYASSELRFNRAKICAVQNSGASEGENPRVANDATATTELLPEPYAGNIKTLMVEADLIIAGYRGIQEAVGKSSCMEIVPEKK